MWRIVALAALANVVAPPSFAASAHLEAGAGKAEIIIPKALLPLDGFGRQYDPLAARVLLLGSGDKRIALLVVDLTSIGQEAVAEMKQIVARGAKVQPDAVWVCAGHTFSAPHMFGATSPPGMAMSADEAARGATYHAAVTEAVTRAVAEAAHAMRPAQIGFGAGVSDVNVNRNVPAADGWWLGADAAGASDKTVSLLRVDDLAHQPIAVLLNYAVQSSVMDHSVGQDGVKGITADLGGAAVRHVEEQLGNGAVSLFLTGAAGDQAPAFAARRNIYDKDGRFREADIGDKGYSLVELQGERLGADALRAAGATTAGDPAPPLSVTNAAIQLDAQERPRSLQQIRPSRTYTYHVQGKAAAPYSIMRIGDVVLVGVQVELAAATGADLRRRSPFAHTIVITMVNGAAKYLPDATGYRNRTYEAMNSSYGPGSAERLEERILRDLRAMHGRGAK